MKLSRFQIITAIFAGSIMSAACAGPEFAAPSLEHRDIEGIANRPMMAIAPVPSASDPGLVTRIDSLVGQAEAGQRNYNAALPAVQRAVSAAGGVESESWIKAQMMLSSLQEPRSQTTSALAELDAILVTQTIAGAPSETERLASARDRVSAIYDDQDRTYEALLAALRTR